MYNKQKVIYSDDWYEGEWKNGEFHGQGTYTSPDGSKFEGEFKDEKFWNGTTYEIDGNIFWITINMVSFSTNQNSQNVQ